MLVVGDSGDVVGSRGGSGLWLQLLTAYSAMRFICSPSNREEKGHDNFIPDALRSPPCCELVWLGRHAPVINVHRLNVVNPNIPKQRALCSQRRPQVESDNHHEPIGSSLLETVMPHDRWTPGRILSCGSYEENKSRQTSGDLDDDGLSPCRAGD